MKDFRKIRIPSSFLTRGVAIPKRQPPPNAPAAESLEVQQAARASASTTAAAAASATPKNPPKRALGGAKSPAAARAPISRTAPAKIGLGATQPAPPPPIEVTPPPPEPEVELLPEVAPVAASLVESVPTELELVAAVEPMQTVPEPVATPEPELPMLPPKVPIGKPAKKQPLAKPVKAPVVAPAPLAVAEPVAAAEPAAPPEVTLAEPVAQPAPVSQPAPAVQPQAASPVQPVVVSSAATSPPKSAALAGSADAKPAGRFGEKLTGRITERFTAPALPSLPAFPLAARPLGRNLWLMVLLVVVAAAAQVALYIRPIAGVYVDAAVFASLLWLALWQERARQLVISVAIIPLAMLVNLSLPQFNSFQRTTNLALVMLILGLVYQYLFTIDYPLEGTRLRMTRHGYLFALPFVVVLGQFLGAIGFGLLRHQYDFRGTSLALVALGSVIFAIAEEVLFRGLIQQRAMLLLHPIVAAVLSALLYTGVMFGHRGGLFSPIFAAILGASLSFVYYKKQNLLLTIGINATAKLTYIGLVAIFVLRT